MDKQTAIDLIRRARKLLEGWEPPSNATASKYSRAFERMGQRKLPPEEIAQTKRGYYFYRAALIYLANSTIQEILREVGRLQKKGDPLWLEKAETLQVFLDMLERYPRDTKRAHLTSGEKSLWSPDGKKPRSNGKRRNLGSLPQDWRQLMWENLPKNSKYKLAVALLSCAGCRPSELEKGIRVTLTEQKTLWIEITGTKTFGGKHGQTKRLLEIKVNTPETKYLFFEASKQIELEITVDSGKALSESIRRLSKRIWPRRKYVVSPYSFRHQLGADIKEYLTPEQIAQVLGHSVDKTQQHYGTRVQRKAGSKILRVQATRPIKPTASKSRPGGKTLAREEMLFRPRP